MSDCSTSDSYDDTSYDSSTDVATFDADMTTSIQIDMDGDGQAETTVFDFDGDGIADAIDIIDPVTGAELLKLDTDADGVMDTAVVDIDGDGIFDGGAADTDGDGFAESLFDPNTGEPIDPTSDGSADPFTPTTDDSTDDDWDVSDDDDDDGVHGDPMAEIPYHQAQVGSNDCLPTSVAMVLSEVTGTEVPQGDVVDLANQLDLLGPDGMSIESGVTLLEHYGVDAEVQTGSVDDLRAMLDAGKPVIIGLDSDDLYGTGDSPFANDMVAGHAVVITGIDDEAGLVYINDPGFPDGAGVAIPLSEFEDAWTDADHSMIVADKFDTTGDTDVDAGEAGNAGGSDDDDSNTLFDLILLPFNLVLH